MTAMEIEARRRLLDAKAALLKQARATEDGTMERRIAEIDEALGRLAAGSFGSCERCGDPIGGQRLRAIPETRRCSKCAKAPAASTASR